MPTSTPAEQLGIRVATGAVLARLPPHHFSLGTPSSATHAPPFDELSETTSEGFWTTPMK